MQVVRLRVACRPTDICTSDNFVTHVNDGITLIMDLQVNGRFGSADYIPVQYVVRTLSHAEIVALYSVANVALVTSIREGVNLSAMEFVACQANVHEQLASWGQTLNRLQGDVARRVGQGIDGKPHQSGEKKVHDRPNQLDCTTASRCPEKGVLVYSEFAGCASSFKVHPETPVI